MILLIPTPVAITIDDVICEKSRNGDTHGPVELIGRPEQGNQGDQGDLLLILSLYCLIQVE